MLKRVAGNDLERRLTEEGCREVKIESDVS